MYVPVYYVMTEFSKEDLEMFRKADEKTLEFINVLNAELSIYQSDSLLDELKIDYVKDDIELVEDQSSHKVIDFGTTLEENEYFARKVIKKEDFDEIINAMKTYYDMKIAHMTKYRAGESYLCVRNDTEEARKSVFMCTMMRESLKEAVVDVFKDPKYPSDLEMNPIYIDDAYEGMEYLVIKAVSSAHV